jgi:hypothetical protein
MRRRFLLPLPLLLGLLAPAQDDKPKPKLDQKKIDRAIEAGIRSLKKVVADPAFFDKRAQMNAEWGIAPRQLYELILWTFLHAEVSPREEAFRRMFKIAIEEPVWKTYNVALLAMILRKLGPTRYHAILRECAQFFVDTQYPNGQWSYPYDGSYRAPRPADERKSLSDSAQSKPDEPPKSASLAGPGGGMTHSGTPDNSNSQYAALGIRACAEAGIEFPKEVIQRARDWLVKCQNYDGGWPYLLPAGLGPESKEGEVRHPSYGSMTLGAIGSLSIFDKLLGENFKKNQSIVRGMDWMAKRFQPDKHPGMEERHNPIKDKRMVGEMMYYLYSMERAGDMFGTESFGPHAWYPEGGAFLLRVQTKDGSWKDPSSECEPVATCFAILFLKRATTPLIETEDASKKK